MCAKIIIFIYISKIKVEPDFLPVYTVCKWGGLNFPHPFPTCGRELSTQASGSGQEIMLYRYPDRGKKIASSIASWIILNIKSTYIF